MKSLTLCLAISSAAYAQAPRVFNTAKQKMKDGKTVVGGTIHTNDPDVYCAMANAGFDYLWIEMQHSPLTYQEVARMIRACKGAPAIPFIRVPDATEGDIQKATDIGALGIILPMVDTMEKVRNAVKFASYPPFGMRSQGGGQYGVLWGADYRQAANANMAVVAMIENPAGVALASEIASTPGVDAVFAASTDLSSFSGWKQGDPRYEAMVMKIHDAVLKAGKRLGGPFAWRGRPGYTFFQGPNEGVLIRAGAKAALGGEAVEGTKKGVAATEGAHP
jgi:2-keto-3-deoxy-L-rhamnonate aldolase RhmA